jgi:hypothetical protein
LVEASDFVPDLSLESNIYTCWANFHRGAIGLHARHLTEGFVAPALKNIAIFV